MRDVVNDWRIGLNPGSAATSHQDGTIWMDTREKAVINSTKSLVRVTRFTIICMRVSLLKMQGSALRFCQSVVDVTETGETSAYCKLYWPAICPCVGSKQFRCFHIDFGGVRYLKLVWSSFSGCFLRWSLVGTISSFHVRVLGIRHSVLYQKSR